MNVWRTLGIKRTDDLAEIRRAYARKLKATDVDADPAAFIAMREALEQALADARYPAPPNPLPYQRQIERAPRVLKAAGGSLHLMLPPGRGIQRTLPSTSERIPLPMLEMFRFRSAMTAPIPVICDRCRAEGEAGDPPFAELGDLLAFEPIPRRPRVDGWTAELQRGYVAVLAVTGSPRRAALAVGKAQFGVTQLAKAKGSEGFNAACEKALAIFAEKGSQRLADGFAAIVREDSKIRPGTGRGTVAGTAMVEGTARSAETPGELTPDEERVRLELLAALIHKYMQKLAAERRCRLDGRIVEADFHLRQLTMLEVSLDVVSGNGMALLRDARRGGHDLLDIAETPMSRVLDSARREHWQACGDPPRPEYPPRHLLVEKDGYAIERAPASQSGRGQSYEEQKPALDAACAQEAADQIAWEAEARRDYEERQRQGDGSGGGDASGDSYS